MRTMTDLKSCPFCTSEKAHVFNEYSEDGDTISGCAVFCDDDDATCKANTGWYKTKQEAIDAWNRRASDE